MSFPKLAIFLSLLPGAFAASQAQTGKTARKPDLEVFGGYSYLDVNIKTSGAACTFHQGPVLTLVWMSVCTARFHWWEK